MHILYPLVIGNWICRNCLRKKKVRRCAPLKWDKIPILVVGGGRKGLSSSSAAHPPLKWETSHMWGVSHVHGVQRPISEYQIIHPPKVHNTSYTLVTGMEIASGSATSISDGSIFFFMSFVLKCVTPKNIPGQETGNSI